MVRIRQVFVFFFILNTHWLPNPNPYHSPYPNNKPNPNLSLNINFNPVCNETRVIVALIISFDRIMVKKKI